MAFGYEHATSEGAAGGGEKPWCADGYGTTGKNVADYTQGPSRKSLSIRASADQGVTQAKEIIDSGALGKIVATTVVGWDNFLLYLPPRHDYEHDAKTRTLSA